MPTPRSGEKKDKFIDRCIPQVIRDGTAQDGSQAAAICHSIWRRRKKAKKKELKDEIDVKLNKIRKELKDDRSGKDRPSGGSVE